MPTISKCPEFALMPILAFLTLNGFELEAETIMKRSFISSTSINPESEPIFRLSKSNVNANIAELCERLSRKFREFKWESQPCGTVQWQADFQTIDRNPLIYAVFGTGSEKTLILSAVHPDELTPVPMGFRLAQYILNNPKAVRQDQQVIIAPLVNPDGLFQVKPQRTNSRGVDPNRNFFTLDWYEKSLSWWENLRKRSLPYFPGHFPNSEIETIFQVRLIDDHQPDKILSIHAPLGFLDYDGPGDQKPLHATPAELQARKLAETISVSSNNYRVVDYSFYPGSLGNFAGNERHIPTVTLELKTKDPDKVDEYWEQFQPGLLQAIHYPFKKILETTGNTQKFYSQYEELALKQKDKS